MSPNPDRTYQMIRVWLMYRARCLEHDGDYEAGALYRRVLQYIDDLRASTISSPASST